MDEIATTNGIYKFITSDKFIGFGLKLLEIVIIVVVGLIAIKIILGITRKALKNSSLDAMLHAFIINGIKVVTVIILITMCLGTLGVQMSTLIAVIGAGGAAIALAMRDSLANIAGGVMIIVTQPFSKNDLIDVGEVSGKVEEIDLFLTTLKTYDNKTITIPNGLINTSVLVNHSMEDNRRVDCTFCIGYNDDIAKAKGILQNVCDANEKIFKEPAPLIGVADHADSSIILDLKAWCTTDDYWDVKYFLEENVKIAFDEHNIEIPYPQMDIHLKK